MSNNNQVEINVKPLSGDAKKKIHDLLQHLGFQEDYNYIELNEVKIKFTKPLTEDQVVKHMEL